MVFVLRPFHAPIYHIPKWITRKNTVCPLWVSPTVRDGNENMTILLRKFSARFRDDISSQEERQDEQTTAQESRTDFQGRGEGLENDKEYI